MTVGVLQPTPSSLRDISVSDEASTSTASLILTRLFHILFHALIINRYEKTPIMDYVSDSEPITSPIDVPDKWIHFVDDNVLASQFSILLINEGKTLRSCEQNYLRALRSVASFHMETATGAAGLGLQRSELNRNMGQNSHSSSK